MKWIKYVAWVLFSGATLGVACGYLGIPEMAMPLGMVVGALITMWCIDKYDLI